MSISRDAVGVCLLGDRLFAVGGYNGQVYLSTVEAYDPQTNEWTQVRTRMRLYTKAHPPNPFPSFQFVPFCSTSRVLFVNVLLPYANAALATAAYVCEQRGDKMERAHSSEVH